MTGSIQVKKGHWYVVICYRDENNAKRYKWISTKLPERGNKTAAKKMIEPELEKFSKELEDSKNKVKERRKNKDIDKKLAFMPFWEYCVKYVESIKRDLVRGTYEGYLRYCNGRIKNFFGESTRLIDVTEAEIEGFYDYARESGAKNVSIVKFNCVIRPALRQAYKDGLIPDNPYEFVPSLKKEKTRMNFYDNVEMAKLFKAIEGNSFELAIKMAGCYGLRRSELLGLKWSAIDWEHKIITIDHRVVVVSKELDFSGFLKTKTSIRTLPLMPHIEKLLLKQKDEIEENKLFYGDSYSNIYSEYVFVYEMGKIIHPETITRNFSKILKENNLKKIRFHDLRHSCASIMLANGIHMKQIQDWLGHANFATTADIYSHLDFSSKINAANVIADAILASDLMKDKNIIIEQKDKNVQNFK